MGGRLLGAVRALRGERKKSKKTPAEALYKAKAVSIFDGLWHFRVSDGLRPVRGSGVGPASAVSSSLTIESWKKTSGGARFGRASGGCASESGIEPYGSNSSGEWFSRPLVRTTRPCVEGVLAQGAAGGAETQRTVCHPCDQATKGTWGMPRRREAMKDVVGCDKPRGAVKRALIRGSPNGATRRHSARRWRHRRMNS